MLLSAQNKFGDNIIVIEKLIKRKNDDETDFSIAAWYEDELFYQGELYDVGSLDKEDVFVDIEDDPLEMVKKKSQKWIKKANTSGFSNEGRKTLVNLIDKDKPILHNRLGGAGPEKSYTHENRSR